MKRDAMRFWQLGFVAGVVLLLCSPLCAQPKRGFAADVSKIIGQPVYRHASFGIEVYSLDRHKVVYAKNAQKLFTPASTTKLLTEGTALELLGPNFRFHTRVYRTGPVSADGTLHGDLVLVASGDPDLSGRIRPDGTLAFENVDHGYDGNRYTKAVPGDPLLVIHELARKIAARGIKKIDGQVLIDISLFPQGEKDLGTGIVISPICVNDNLIDVTATPGAKPGDPVQLRVSPKSAYAKFVNQLTTGAADSQSTFDWSKDQKQPDGSHVVTITGAMPAGGPSILYSYRVPEPNRFAEMTLVEALRADGVQADFAPYGAKVDFSAFRSAYTAANLVGEHVSPPLSQDVKVTLKVSQNLHASMMPYILGAVLGHADKHIQQAGFDLEHAFLSKAGLDLSGASQSDGAGGARAAFFTPDFMCHYLAFMTTRKNFPVFERALPILGRDGTLWMFQVHSPAAGHVFAKTGTYFVRDRLNDDVMVTAKGLAGYVTSANGGHYVFALYVNRVSMPANDLLKVETLLGGTLGKIASAIYTTGPTGP
jgi:PBP4 family serine-type D-alanyl-D-alanine carboxypeptidase